MSAVVLLRVFNEIWRTFPPVPRMGSPSAPLHMSVHLKAPIGPATRNRSGWTATKAQVMAGCSRYRQLCPKTGKGCQTLGASTGTGRMLLSMMATKARLRTGPILEGAGGPLAASRNPDVEPGDSMEALATQLLWPATARNGRSGAVCGADGA